MGHKACFAFLYNSYLTISFSMNVLQVMLTIQAHMSSHKVFRTVECF
jgi:hypothetical protein